MVEVVDFIVMQKWNKIPPELQQKILSNVWCGKCLTSVRIVDYTMKNEDFGVVIGGKCKLCGWQVARVLEED